MDCYTAILPWTAILLNYYTTILLYYYTTILLYYNTTILLYYYTTILLYYYISMLLYYYTTILLYYFIRYNFFLIKEGVKSFPGIFRAVSTIESRAAITIAESAMLKIGQYGNCIQSMTFYFLKFV